MDREPCQRYAHPPTGRGLTPSAPHPTQGSDPVVWWQRRPLCNPDTLRLPVPPDLLGHPTGSHLSASSPACESLQVEALPLPLVLRTSQASGHCAWSPTEHRTLSICTLLAVRLVYLPPLFQEHSCVPRDVLSLAVPDNPNLSSR